MPGPESKEINFVRRKKKRGEKGIQVHKTFFKQLAYNTYSGIKYGKNRIEETV